jgi:branched-subunit amino acid permease
LEVVMSTRDRIVAAASWWFALIAALGLLVRAEPPLHLDARRHCLFGLVGNLALALLYIAVAAFGRSGGAGAALASCLACLWGAIALTNTAAAAAGKGPFFTSLEGPSSGDLL